MVWVSYRSVVLPVNALEMDISVPLPKWLSKVILKTSTRENLSIFRALKRILINLVNARSHLLYNVTCSNIYKKHHRGLTNRRGCRRAGIWWEIEIIVILMHLGLSRSAYQLSTMILICSVIMWLRFGSMLVVADMYGKNSGVNTYYRDKA